MYEEFFSLSGQPFKLNPDPKFFYGSRSHNKAMAYLHYGLRQAEGFIVITGEIGAGKSMLISHLLDQLDRSRIAAAHLLTPNLGPDDLLSHILSSFRVEPSGDGKTAYLEAFEDFLFDQLNHGRRVLLIVDEAQNLPVATLEELRILSNMDYDGTPLFQVFLVGQPDFRPVLAGDNMEQLRQRIIASYHLEPLGQAETEDYIKHRMAVVGWTDDPAFTEECFHAIHRETGGIPRKVNKLCNRILLYCSLEELHVIDAKVVTTVAADMNEENVAKLEVPASEKSIAPVPLPEPVPVNADAPEKAMDDEVGALAARRPNGAALTPDEQSAEVSALADADTDQIQGLDDPAEPETLKEDVIARDETESEVEGIMASDAKSMQEPSTNEGATTEADEAPEADLSQMSVLDRLRAQKARAKDASEKAHQKTEKAAPATATMSDVADAIAAASTTATPVDPKADEFDTSDIDGELDGPSLYDDDKGWRQTVVRSINETRDELKKAHSTVSQVRRAMTDADKERQEKAAKIAASLSRAETLLAEMRNA